ncbi:MAG TPA: DUF3606 domain-containing protein [Chitinophagaceae bacterium]|jgi:hypothetical protein|nr:DUF3606 domain-containing protein [Chitinophagaceae bacterium]
MPNKKDARGTSQDRRKVAGAQDHEVNYEKEKMGTTGEKVKAAVKKVGNERKKVEAALKKK